MIPFGLLLAYFLVELASIPLYLRILFLLCTRLAFKSPFFRMLVILGILDLHLFFAHFIGVRLPMSQFFLGLYADLPQSRWIGILHFFTFFCAYSDYFVHIAITLNRFTSIALPLKHNKLWSKYFHIVPIVAILLGFCLAGHRLFSLGAYIPYITDKPQLGFTGLPIRYLLWEINDSLILASVGIGCAIFCFLLNSITFLLIVRFKRAQRQHSAPNSTSSMQHEFHWGSEEFNLFVISISLMISQAVYASFNVIYLYIRGGTTTSADFYLQPQSADRRHAVYVLFHQLAWMTDLFIFGLPWLLLALNQTLRGQIVPKWLGEKLKMIKDKDGRWKVAVSNLNSNL